HGACVEQDDKGWDARKRAYCLKIQPATGSFARNLIYSTKPFPIFQMLFDFSHRNSEISFQFRKKLSIRQSAHSIHIQILFG
ncbi:hypothetical protein, partial [Klebsiella quasipneumoniae]|uniref:hypothetical protein n=1 Tax=Klebsiella quasipneumoniae TaxID=1463165 RepID=UPI003745930A